MPRKSRAAREIEPWIRPAEVLPIQPPASLSEAAKGVWVDLVSTHEPEHFRKGDATLMQQYCEAWRSQRRRPRVYKPVMTAG